jgi:hypothetical protein
MSNQIETQIDVSLTERNRLTAFFRGILVLPVILYFFAFTPGDEFYGFLWVALGVGFVLPVAMALVVRQKYPSYLLAINEALLGLRTRLLAYICYLTDEYPSIEDNDIVSVTFPEIEPKELNRWLPLIKWVLAFPLYVVGVFYFIYSYFLTVIGLFSILFTGKYPEFCAEGVVGTIAYWNRVAGYALLMVTDEYPTFSL